MNIQRLSWAGLKIESGNAVLLIDAVENYVKIGSGQVFHFSDDVRADIILITHLHFDHYDAATIRKCLKPGGKLVVSSLYADKVKADGFNPVELQLEQSFSAGAFKVTPVFAMDGVGDKQVSWVVEDNEHRILHGGDTIWHNQFWHIQELFKSFDVVFLPVNGAVMHFPHLPFSPIPATLTPKQAVAAAGLLHAGRLCPIHYGFHEPGFYEEYPHVKEAVQEAAAEMDVQVSWLQPSNYFNQLAPVLS